MAHAKSKGFEVHALSSPGEPLDEFGRDMQIEVHAALMPRRITPLVDLAALWRIVRVIRRVRPTIVDAHTPKGSLLAMMAATLCRVPVRIYHQHGLPLMTATGLKRRILRWTERTTCRLAHQVICISKSLREVPIAEGLCPPEKIKVLGQGSIDGVEADRKFNPARISTESARLVREAIAPFVSGGIGRICRDFGFGAARGGSPKGRMAIRRVLRRGRQRQQLSRHGRPRSRVDGGAVWASTFEQVAGPFGSGLRGGCLAIRSTCSVAGARVAGRIGVRCGFGKSAQSRSARFAWR